jgi:hypothetical protein
MQRTPSTMTAADFEAWLRRHELTRAEAADKLGVGLRVVYAFLSGERRIPRTVELLCKALDRLERLRYLYTEVLTGRRSGLPCMRHSKLDAGAHGPTCAVQSVVSYLGYTGRAANVAGMAAHDPYPPFILVRGRAQWPLAAKAPL